MFREPSPKQPLLPVEQPQLPIARTIIKDRFELRLKLQGWILQQIARDRGRYIEEDVRQKDLQRLREEQARVEKTVLDADTALLHIQTAQEADFNHYPVFYKALWEVMKAKGWDKEPKTKNRL